MKKEKVKFNSLGQWSIEKAEENGSPSAQTSNTNILSAQQAKTNKLLSTNVPKFVESVVTKPKKRQQDRRGTSPIKIEPAIERRTSSINRRGNN